MDRTLLLQLIKSRLGISATVRDEYITAILDGCIEELEDEKGIILEAENHNHIMFCVDYTCWRYLNRDGNGAIPRDIQFRLHNLILHSGGGTA